MKTFMPIRSLRYNPWGAYVLVPIATSDTLVCQGATYATFNVAAGISRTYTPSLQRPQMDGDGQQTSHRNQRIDLN